MPSIHRTLVRGVLATTLLASTISTAFAATRDVDSLMPPLANAQATSRSATTNALSRVALRVESYDALVRRDPSIKASKAEVARMQHYLRNTYQGMTTNGTFVVGAETFDCVPIAQQPSLRGGGTVAAPPLGLRTSRSGTSAQRCAEGSVPFRRLTIDEIAAHRTLEDFLSKERPEAADDRHYYAHVAQTAPSNILGGGAGLNLWKPVVDNHTMSLLQIWLSGQSEANATQTAEVGWQVQPGAWNTYDPTIFVYWTADGYSQTGCYNLGCTGFVQTASDLALGSSIPSDRYSVKGGSQGIVNVSWQRNNDDGSWWLVLDGEAVGYLPGNLYGQGDLGRADGNRLMDAGGEIADGGKPAAPMGSGEYADAGYRQAAFVTDLHYLDGNLAKQPVDLMSGNTWINPTPHCYTLSLIGVNASDIPGGLPEGTSTTPNHEAGMSGTSFYLGGPGTANADCQAANPSIASRSLR
ncbi:MAG: hypothetical protein GAK28_04236 [Luteibacter sp.]|uniref:neprosin family prolyl endopeptidase n=1 Tax=Luteibacter sp. TaxID=1886636 RepID=UPI0013822DA3|nr:neprosin family prolyl endopeptidase [Luteibacter sp.]KAF1004072.1 MAG: hypothetical protein GAK28_04236 [Luteibacter sp.]